MMKWSEPHNVSRLNDPTGLEPLGFPSCTPLSADHCGDQTLPQPVQCSQKAFFAHQLWSDTVV